MVTAAQVPMGSQNKVDVAPTLRSRHVDERVRCCLESSREALLGAFPNPVVCFANSSTERPAHAPLPDALRPPRFHGSVMRANLPPHGGSPDDSLCCVYLEDWSLDEKTSHQPRTRSMPNRPARVGGAPVLVEAEYELKGALQLLAAFNTRTGEVIGRLRRSKRQREFIELLDAIDARTLSWVKVIHVIRDNASIHEGRLVHQRFRIRMHYTPVHCSWMNQIEQWFSILQRKRLTAPNFADLDALAERVHAFIDEWNQPTRRRSSRWSRALSYADAARWTCRI